jgi:ketosteroid isomerase-like protein
LEECRAAREDDCIEAVAGDAAMSAEANKKLMQEIFAAAGNPDPAVRDRSLFIASLADDVKWVVTGQYSWSRTFTGKESILNDLHGHVRSLLVDRARTIADRFIADGDIVVVEARGNNLTKTGVRYDNEYCLVFRLANGKIREVREYCDSVLTENALGRFPGPREVGASARDPITKV